MGEAVLFHVQVLSTLNKHLEICLQKGSVF